MSKYDGLGKAHDSISHTVLAMDNLVDAIQAGTAMYDSMNLPAYHQLTLKSDLIKAFNLMTPISGGSRK